MSASYLPVTWNRNKLIYDAVLLAAVAVYILTFLRLAPSLQPSGVEVDDLVRRMHAFGTCAFLMLTFILCLGPLARLDPRWLPLLYNRRHFGVITCAVALAHAQCAMAWYFAYSAIDPSVALFASNTSYFQLAGFPFEILGFLALLILCILAATSHDFWLSFFRPTVWKSLHMLIYLAYALVVAHIAFGALQTGRYPALAFIASASAMVVAGLHLAAALTAAAPSAPAQVIAAEWIDVAEAVSIPEGRGRTVPLPGGKLAAVMRQESKFYALDNACAHQAGPLGEGCVIDGLLTCPWHGFQYRLKDGCAPPPFSEKLATYRTRIENGRLLIDPRANPPGTPVEPAQLEGRES